MPRLKKSINFEEDNHAFIAALQRKLIAERDDMVSLEETAMVGARLLAKQLEVDK